MQRQRGCAFTDRTSTKQNPQCVVHALCLFFGRYRLSCEVLCLSLGCGNLAASLLYDHQRHRLLTFRRPFAMAPPLHDQLDIVIPTIRSLDFLEQW